MSLVFYAALAIPLSRLMVMLTTMTMANNRFNFFLITFFSFPVCIPWSFIFAGGPRPCDRAGIF